MFGYCSIALGVVMGAKVTLVVEDYSGDWVTLEFETEANKIVTQDENEMIDYLFGLVLGDSVEASDTSFILIIDYTDGSSFSRWKLL
jgi:hypothetical protein